jgi:hypothetical protein
MATLDEVLAESTKGGRICPQPNKWNELWELLPNKQRKGAGWEPSLPLILAAWHDTPHMMKIIRFQEHIRWAATHGKLDQIYDFITSLKPEEWYLGK